MLYIICSIVVPYSVGAVLYYIGFRRGYETCIDDLKKAATKRR